MAFSISYIYQVVDKFSAPLRKIEKANTTFRGSMRRTQAGVNRLSKKLLAVKGIAESTATSIGGPTTIGKINRLKQNVDELKPSLSGITNETQKLNRELKKKGTTSDKAARKVEHLTKKTNRLKRALNTTSKATANFSNRVNSFQGVVGGLVAGMGGKVLLDKFVGFDNVMNVARGTTKATESDFEKLRLKAKALGLDTRYNATQAAAGISMLGRNSLTATQILGGAIDATLLLSSSTGTELTNSADIATDAMANFNKKASEMLNVVDSITGVTINSKFNIDDYRLALGQAGGVAGAVGVAFDDFNTSIAAVAPLFASGSDAGTSFKTFLQRLNPQSKEAAEIMKKVGLMTSDGASAFFDASGKMKGMTDIAGALNKVFGKLTEQQANYVASTVFGTDAMRFAIGLSKVSSKEFDNLSAAIKKVDAKKLAADRMRGLGGALLSMSSAFEAVTVAVFESGLANTLVKISNQIIYFTRALAKSNPLLLKIIGYTGMLVAILAPALVMAGIAAMAFSSLAAVFAGLTAAIAAPIAAIVAIVSIFSVAYIKSKHLRNAIENIAKAFYPVFNVARNVFLIFKKLAGLFNSVTGNMFSMKGVGDLLSVAFDGIALTLYTLLTPIRLFNKALDWALKKAGILPKKVKLPKTVMPEAPKIAVKPIEKITVPEIKPITLKVNKPKLESAITVLSKFPVTKKVSTPEITPAITKVEKVLATNLLTKVLNAPPELPEPYTTTIERKGVAVEDSLTMKGVLDGTIRISTTPGIEIEEAKVLTSLPGNLGFNMAGAY